MRIVDAIFLLLIAISFSVLTINTSAAQDWSHSEQELWNLEKKYMTLLKEGDVQGLSEYWHEDFIGWPSHSANPLDPVEGRVSLGALLGSIKITSFTFFPKAIRVVNNIAIVHYQVEFEVQPVEGDKENNSYRVIHTWLKDEDKWSIIGGMSSKIESGDR
jgi:ketosteroid isomerase-like protein